MRHGLTFSVPVIAILLIFRVDILILSHYKGAAEAGKYAVASQVGNLPAILLGVIAAIFFSRTDGESTAPAARRSAVAMLVLCLVVAASGFLLPTIYGTDFAESRYQLWILLPGLLLIGVQSVLVEHFARTGLPSVIPLFWVLTIALNLILNIMLVPPYGGRGAALASTMSYSVVFILVSIYFWAATRRRPRDLFVVRGEELRSALRPSSPTNAHL